MIVIRDQTPLHRFATNFSRCHPFAVILDINDNIAAFLIGAESNGTFFRFAVLPPFFGNLNAMIHGIAHHVDQWVINGIHHITVNLGFLAPHNEIHLLPGLFRQITDKSCHLLKGLTNGHHAH